MDLCTFEMNGYFFFKGKENVNKITNELCVSGPISQVVEGFRAVNFDPLVIQGARC